MLEPHRRVHFRLWILLAALLPLLLLAAFINRPHPGAGPAAQRIGALPDGLAAASLRGVA